LSAEALFSTFEPTLISAASHCPWNATPKPPRNSSAQQAVHQVAPLAISFLYWKTAESE
jgi:hypothetical protein